MKRIAAGLLVLTAIAGSVHAGQPADIVQEIYANVGMESEPSMRGLFTNTARAQLEANEAAGEAGDMGCIDFGIATDAQDFDAEEIARTLELDESLSDGTAIVMARFMLFGELRQIEWTLEETDAGWKIADVAGPDNGWRLSELDCR